MVTKFPDLIEFIDDMGLCELHKIHHDYVKECEDISFSDFVKVHHEGCRQMWEDDMRCGRKKVNILFDEDSDILIETAKMVMAEIINRGLRDNWVRQIVLEDDLAPDCYNAVHIVEIFNRKVLPAVEKTLNELKG
jgi:hypothetical protein